MFAGPCAGNRLRWRVRAARSGLCTSLQPHVCGLFLNVPHLDFATASPRVPVSLHLPHPLQSVQTSPPCNKKCSSRAGLWQVPGTEEVLGDVC